MKHKIFKPETYAAFAAAFLAQNANGQIIINDYEPDLRLMNWTTDAPETDSLFIDIDDNGIYDIFLYVDDEIDWHHELYMKGNDCVTGIYGFVSGWGAYVAKGVSTGYVFGPDIDASNWLDEELLVKSAIYQTWSNSTSDGCSYGTTWFNHNQSYYGLKLNIDGATHYGWLRLDSPNLLGRNPEEECGSSYGSPVDAFEAGYEMEADVPVTADNGALTYKEQWVYLTDVWDVPDFSSLALHIIDYTGLEPQFSEMRIYVIADSTEALNFSVAQALALPAENYAVFHQEGVIDYDTLVHLPATLKDIDGNDFDPAKKYSGYTLKIPIEDQPLTLSSPMAVVNPHPNECELFTTINSVSIIGAGLSAADIEVNFSANLYGEDQISEYRISLGTNCEEFDVNALAPDQYKAVPVSGAASYTTTLETILRDMNGDPILPASYAIRIWAQADNELTSLPCTANACAAADFTAVINMIAGNGISVIQNENLLQINIQNLNPGNYTCVVSDISGRKIIDQDLKSEINTIPIDHYAPGIYIATVYLNNFPAAVSKISVL